MKTFLIALLTLIMAAPLLADDHVYIGPALIVDDAGSCSVNYADGTSYKGSVVRHLFANSATGRAQFKCKLYWEENSGPQKFIEILDYESGAYPFDAWGYVDAICTYNIEIDGPKGIWIATCSNVWEDGQ